MTDVKFEEKKTVPYVEQKIRLLVEIGNHHKSSNFHLFLIFCYYYPLHSKILKTKVINADLQSATTTMFLVEHSLELGQDVIYISTTSSVGILTSIRAVETTGIFSGNRTADP